MLGHHFAHFEISVSYEERDDDSYSSMNYGQERGQERRDRTPRAHLNKRS